MPPVDRQNGLRHEITKDNSISPGLAVYVTVAVVGLCIRRFAGWTTRAARRDATAYARGSKAMAAAGLRGNGVTAARAAAVSAAPAISPTEPPSSSIQPRTSSSAAQRRNGSSRHAAPSAPRPQPFT
jgi:hypothetical protein